MNRFRIVLSLAAVLLVFAVIQLTSSRADAASSSEIREQINAMEEQQAQLEEMVERTFEGSLPAFIAAFSRSKKLSLEEIDQLQALIDAHKKSM